MKNKSEVLTKNLSLVKDFEAMLVLENGKAEVKKLLKVLDIDEEQLEDLIDSLNKNYRKADSVMFVRRREDDVELFINSSYDSPLLVHYQQKKGKVRLAALETLSIIAYEQPITLPEVDQIRGVSSVAQLKFLLEEKLVLADGKKEGPGNPTLFKTSPYFLDRFNLKSLKDLPELAEVKTYSFLQD